MILALFVLVLWMLLLLMMVRRQYNRIPEAPFFSPPLDKIPPATPLDTADIGIYHLPFEGPNLWSEASRKEWLLVDGWRLVLKSELDCLPDDVQVCNSVWGWIPSGQAGKKGNSQWIYRTQKPLLN